MRADIVRTACDEHLSPIICRIALIVADVEGEEGALNFLASCRLDQAGGALSTPGANRLLPSAQGGARRGGEIE